jgi:tetratricopeptide (TPR) repeat protein
VARQQLARFERIKGHDENVLSQARVVLTLKDADQPPAHQGQGFATMRSQSHGLIALLTGDFAHASEAECAHVCALGRQRISQSQFAARMHDVAGSRAYLSEARAAGQSGDADRLEAQYWIDAETANWAIAIADIQAAAAANQKDNSELNPQYLAAEQSTHYAPLLALAEARIGDFTSARTIIGRTPIDCYDCLRARGEIAAAQDKWDVASFWFAKAVQQGPSIPFAYSEWGAMLLAKGDRDGAIAKFAHAHQKGPHFADPLELWGEVLMLENRSDLALAKFAEAARYTPNWGRLHLKWGEALHWLGRDGEAKAHWAAAAKLDLTDAERAALKRNMS